MSSERCPLPPGECCRDGGSEQAASWPECTGPRVSMGGLQRSGGLPPKAWSSCRLPADASSAPSCCEGLNEVLSGLFIASGRAAARLGDLHAAKVTHVVNAAPSVELCWHQQHLVRAPTDASTAARWGEAGRAGGAPGVAGEACTGGAGT